MVTIDSLFQVVYGVNLELVNCEECSKEEGVPFVSRTAKNNGVAGYVKKIDGKKMNPGNTISVAGSGSVLSSFYQKEPYYSGRDLFYLSPKVEMSEKQMLFYCMAIKHNVYKYSFGRQANITLKSILVPDIHEIPQEFLDYNFKLPQNTALKELTLKLEVSKWKVFKFGGKNGLFIIKNGYYNKKPEHYVPGSIPFIGASMFNNGVTDYFSIQDIDTHHKDERSLGHSLEQKIFKGNCVTVANNGVGVGSAFYQEADFTCSHDVNVLYLADREWNKYIALFICTMIQLDKYRWAYGRKWRPSRMPESELKLPIDIEGKPDWHFMEEYIKSLPYSASI